VRGYAVLIERIELSMLSRYVVICSLLSLQACTIGVRAYPINKEAQSIGILDVEYTQGLGRGPVTIKLRDGTEVHGNYQTYFRNAPPPTFGALYHSVIRTSEYTLNGKPGIVEASNQNGIHLYCEYFIVIPGNDGTGVCKENGGGLFQILWHNSP
jgi:hypothetical protein